MWKTKQNRSQIKFLNTIKSVFNILVKSNRRMLCIPSPSHHFLSSLNFPAFISIPELQRAEKMLNFVSAPSRCQGRTYSLFSLLIIRESQQWFLLQVCIFPFLVHHFNSWSFAQIPAKLPQIVLFLFACKHLDFARTVLQVSRDMENTSALSGVWGKCVSLPKQELDMPRREAPPASRRGRVTLSLFHAVWHGTMQWAWEEIKDMGLITNVKMHLWFWFWIEN